jgi:histidinol-phosphate aminotransferase
LARPAVRTLEAYVSARAQAATAEIFLDANEAPSPGAAGHQQIHRYPEPQPKELVDRLCALYHTTAERMVIGRGTDDIIDAVLRTFCEAERDRIIICPPTYGVYQVYARLQGAGVTEVPLGNDFALDTDGVMRAATPVHKLVFVCSPNNPTGTLVPQPIIAKLAERLAERAIVVVDEAYLEFSGQPSCEALRLPNLIVLRTLSKAFGLAGARAGVGLADPRIIALLQKVRAPYPLARPAIRAVLDGLAEERSREMVALVCRERERLSLALDKLRGVERVFSSDANFLLVRMRDAKAALRVCRQDGILIRDRSGEPGLDNCVRITVGDVGENDRLLAALEPL